MEKYEENLWRNMKEIWRNIFPNFPITWKGTRSEEKVLWDPIQSYLSSDWGEGGSEDTFPQIRGANPRKRSLCPHPKVPFLRLMGTNLYLGDGHFPDPDSRKRSYGSPSKDTFPRIEGSGRFPWSKKKVLWVPIQRYLSVGLPRLPGGASRGRGHNSWDGP